MHGINRMTACLPAFLAAVVLCLPAGVSQAGPLSPSVVLVLKLVAADRVQPVTGIVVSGDGLVLVPADFVSTPAELVVLDGGTDILGNGRPASVYKQLPDAGLALLSVAGLKRPAVALSATAGGNDSRYLEAFPPARQIAEGAEPLQIELGSETPLPYVSGAILDDCGLLSGMTLTTGNQSMETGKQPVIIDTQALLAAFEEFQLSVPRAACRVVHAQAEESSGESPPGAPAPEVTEPAVEIPPRDRTEAIPAGQIEAVAGAKMLEQAAPVEPEPVAGQLPERVPASRVIPWWLQLSGLLVLALLARGIFRARGQRKRTLDPASAEPDTVRLTGGNREPAAQPRTGRTADKVPDFGDLPADCDGFVVLEGELEKDRTARFICPVDTQRFDLVVGRGEADIRIENAAVSRRHARLICRSGSMTLTDLGSSNGLQINRVPCLPGEVMYVEPRSEICFGDVCLTLELLRREALT